MMHVSEIAAQLLTLYPPRAGDRRLRRSYTVADNERLKIDVLLARIDKQANL